MSFSLTPHLPEGAVNMVIGTLMPLMRPPLDTNPASAWSLITRMLEEYRPQTLRELGLAGEIIGLQLSNLGVLADIGGSTPAEARRTGGHRQTCGLIRAEIQAQRYYGDLQRQRATEQDTTGLADAPRTAPDADATRRSSPAAETAPSEASFSATPPSDTPHSNPGPSDTPSSDGPSVGESGSGTPPCMAAKPGPETEADRPAGPVAASATELDEARATYADAAARLAVMQSRYKGAPPPHSQAAQQIQAQLRVVNAARLRAEQVRQRHTAAAALTRS
jgi:hypothetical protein